MKQYSADNSFARFPTSERKNVSPTTVETPRAMFCSSAWLRLRSETSRTIARMFPSGSGPASISAGISVPSLRRMVRFSLTAPS